MHVHSRRPIKALQLAALVALVAYGAHSAAGVGRGSLDALFEDGIFNAILVAGAALALLRAASERRDRAAWTSMGLGLALWSAGEIISTVNPAMANGAFPSLCDVLWLAFYPAAFVTLVLLVRSRVREFYPSLWLDGLLGVLTLAAIAAQFVFPPIVAATGSSGRSVAGDLVYPIGDSLLMVFVIGVLAVTGWRPGRRLALVSAGFALGAAADCWSLYWSATGHSGPTALDGLWPASALVLGSAAWARDRGVARVRLDGLRLLVLPLLFALSGLGLLALGGMHRIEPAAYALSLTLLTGVVVRMSATFSENVKVGARNRRDAHTDPLTRLPNRRQLMLDLEEALTDATEARPYWLAIFDLNGFKGYNDAFGHPAGDRLLAELGMRLDHAVADHGRAYRLGGDEFCAVYFPGASTIDFEIAAARGALSERGDGIEISAGYGAVSIPREARDVAHALEIADERLYAQKRRSRPAIDPTPLLGREDVQCA
jgi:two-component system, cell cycle response regulator